MTIIRPSQMVSIVGKSGLLYDRIELCPINYDIFGMNYEEGFIYFGILPLILSALGLSFMVRFYCLNTLQRVNWGRNRQT